MSIRGSYRQVGGAVYGKYRSTNDNSQQIQREGLSLRGAGCWFESVISGILKLPIKSKDITGGVFVGNSH